MFRSLLLSSLGWRLLLLVTVLLVWEHGRRDGGRQGGTIARSPGFGLIQTSVRIKRTGNVSIEPGSGARHCVKCFMYINS